MMSILRRLHGITRIATFAIGAVDISAVHQGRAKRIREEIVE